MQIDKLENLVIHNVNKSIEKHEKIMKLAHLDEEMCTQCFYVIVDDEFAEIPDRDRNLKEILKKLTEAVHNQNMLQKSPKRPDNVSLGKFESIKGYNEEYQKNAK